LRRSLALQSFRLEADTHLTDLPRRRAAAYNALMPRPTGLRVRPRRPTGFTITGTVVGQRIRRRAQSNSVQLAREEATTLEAEILRTEWHGQRRGARSFAAAVQSYLEAAPRSEHTLSYVRRILAQLGDVRLASIDQDTATRLRSELLRPNAAPSTYLREIVTPLRAILRHAADRGWCDIPRIKAPTPPPGRTLYLLPSEVERLIAAAAPHLQPLLVFLVGTGARMSEAVYLEWRDVDLAGARAIFWKTKSGKRRNAHLPPCVVAALAKLPHREGKVFQSDKGRPYADRRGAYGGQIKKGWYGTIRRAGLASAFTPHDLRHTWASWHYALHRDLLALKTEGGWSSVTLVERYAHLLPAGQEPAIRCWLAAS
jgi:integrase